MLGRRRGSRGIALCSTCDLSHEAMCSSRARDYLTRSLAALACLRVIFFLFFLSPPTTTRSVVL